MDDPLRGAPQQELEQEGDQDREQECEQDRSRIALLKVAALWAGKAENGTLYVASRAGCRRGINHRNG